MKMVVMWIHLFLLLSLPLATLCQQHRYQVISLPSKNDMCVVFTVPNGESVYETESNNVGGIGCFEDGACVPARDDCNIAEDRCDPNLAKEKHTERMVRVIREKLIQELKYGKEPALIIRQLNDSAAGGDNTGWAAFDAAVNKTVNQDCYSRRGLTLDFIARDNDHDENLLTLGYGIYGEDLRVDDDEELDNSIDRSSVRGLGYCEQIPLSLILKGDSSLGSYLSDAFGSGVKVLPSPRYPKPDERKTTEPHYYRGGYTVKQFGSCCNEQKMDAIQVAIPEGFMAGASNAEANALKMAKGIAKFLIAIHIE